MRNIPSSSVHQQVQKNEGTEKPLKVAPHTVIPLAKLLLAHFENPLKTGTFVNGRSLYQLLQAAWQDFQHLPQGTCRREDLDYHLADLMQMVQYCCDALPEALHHSCLSGYEKEILPYVLAAEKSPGQQSAISQRRITCAGYRQRRQEEVGAQGASSRKHTLSY